MAIVAGLLGTGVASLGSLASFGLSRARFFGRDSISFLFIPPIALPGSSPGSPSNSFFVIWGVSFSLWTIVIGHATFCVVIVSNDCRRGCGAPPARSSRHRRILARPSSRPSASTLPVIGTALVAGGLLAFALSWTRSWSPISRPARRTPAAAPLRLHPPGAEPPIVNAIALVVIVVSLIPVALAQRLTSDPGIGTQLAQSSSG